LSAPAALSREQAAANVPPKAKDESKEAHNSRVQEALDRLTAGHNKTLEAAQQEMLRLKELKKWTFLLSSYNADALRLSRKNLVQQIEQEDAEEKKEE